MIADAPPSDGVTEIEGEFADIIIALSQVSVADRHLADAYICMYQNIKEGLVGRTTG